MDKEILLNGKDLEEVCLENNIYSICNYDFLEEEDKGVFTIKYELRYDEFDCDYYIERFEESRIVTIGDYDAKNESIVLEEYQVVYDEKNEEMCLKSLERENKYITDYDVSDYYIKID